MFFSMHPGGVNFVFADGHVTFLTNETDPQVFEDLSTRAGGEVIPTARVSNPLSTSPTSRPNRPMRFAILCLFLLLVDRLRRRRRRRKPLDVDGRHSGRPARGR